MSPSVTVFVTFSLAHLSGISPSKETCFLINVNFASCFSPPCLSLEWQQLTLKSYWQVWNHLILLQIAKTEARGSWLLSSINQQFHFVGSIEKLVHSNVFKGIIFSAPNIQTTYWSSKIHHWRKVAQIFSYGGTVSPVLYPSHMHSWKWVDVAYSIAAWEEAQEPRKFSRQVDNCTSAEGRAQTSLSVSYPSSI